MPKISIPIKNGYPAESLISMAEALGKMTNTAVECQAVVEITAADPVIKALAVLAPMAKARKYGNRYTKQVQDETPIDETQTNVGKEKG